MNELISIAMSLALIGIAVCFANKNKFHEYKTYTSPDEKYELTVCAEADKFRWFPLAELRIEWLMEKNKIYYNRTDYIALKAMKISC